MKPVIKEKCYPTSVDFEPSEKVREDGVESVRSIYNSSAGAVLTISDLNAIEHFLETLTEECRGADMEASQFEASEIIRWILRDGKTRMESLHIVLGAYDLKDGVLTKPKDQIIDWHNPTKNINVGQHARLKKEKRRPSFPDRRS